MNWSLDLSEKWKIPSYMAKTELHAQDALSVGGFWLAGQVKRLTATVSSRLKNSWSSAVKGESPRGANTEGGTKAKRSELVPTPNRKLVAWIGSSVSYAPDYEYGTAPHTITVKDASVLTNGKSFFGKSVNHPGTPAYAPLRKAWRSNKKQLLRFLAGRMKK